MTDLVADPLTLLPTPLAYGLGAVALLVIAVALFMVVEGLYLVALGLHLARDSRQDGRPRAAAALLAAFCLTTAASRLDAQQEQPAPTIEPRFTRIFGSDSMSMGRAVLSPDGRWVVFARSEGPQAFNLWLVSTRGGDPIRLTSGSYWDDFPTWFPTSDRVAFRSDRPRRDAHQPFVMTIPVDSRTGRATEPPRQVSLDPGGMFAPAVSPDGGRIAYYTSTGQLSTHSVTVIPSTGGAAQRAAVYGDSVTSISGLQWSADGEWISFVAGIRGTNMRKVARVPAAGGAPQLLATLRTMLLPAVTSPGGRHLLRRTDVGPGNTPSYEVLSTDGRPLARFALHRNMFPWAFTPDGHGLIATQSNTVAPIRVVPVAGGAMRQLTDARYYDWPIGWSADASRVFVSSSSNGRDVVLDVPLAGGPATEWPMPAEARSGYVSRDGQYLAHYVGTNAVSRPIRVVRLSDGRTREITATSFSNPGLYLTGPGGRLYISGDAFLYLERRNMRLELWAVSPEGPPSMLRSFPANLAGRTTFAVHGNRIAYTERRGDSTALFVAEGREGRPRHLVSVAGNAVSLVWSHSGRWIASDYYPPGENPRHGVLVVEVAASGAAAGPARFLESGAMVGWQIQWLPSDEAFTVFGMTGAGSETHVYLVSLREGDRPVVLTRDDPSVRWGYELSPDGRYVAYPAEIERGSSIWRVDLSEVLAPAGERGARRRP